MHSSGILGVDLCSDCLRVVQVSQGHKGPVLDHWASMPVPTDASVTALTEALQKTVQQTGFTSRTAVFGLPEDRGFVQCFSEDKGAESLPAGQGASQADYVTDAWRTDEGRVVRGVVARGDVSRLFQVAGQAGVELTAVELRSMACLTALGLLQDHKPTEAALGFIVDSNQITLALAAEGAIVMLESRGRETRDRHAGGLAAAGRMFRLAQMTGFEIEPAVASIIATETDAEAVAQLEARLGVPLHRVTPGQDVRLDIRPENAHRSPEYAAAIGLALEGLRHGARAKTPGKKTSQRHPFNFLRKRPARQRKVSLSWRKIVTAAVVLGVVALAWKGRQALELRGEIQSLEQTHQNLIPHDSEGPDPRALWQTVRGWVAHSSRGKRTAYRPILDEIARLLPAGRAYVASLDISPPAEESGIVVRLEVRARDQEVRYEFVQSLNNSKIFERAEEGRVEPDESPDVYVQRFTITCVVRQPEDV